MAKSKRTKTDPKPAQRKERDSAILLSAGVILALLFLLGRVAPT